MLQLQYHPKCSLSQRIIILLDDKGIEYKKIDVSIKVNSNLKEMGGVFPLLIIDVDKNNRKSDLLIADSNLACEYLVEKYPNSYQQFHFLPFNPEDLAKIRQIINDLENDLFKPAAFLDMNIEQEDKNEVKLNQLKIINTLDQIAENFTINKKMEFFCSSSFTILDIYLLVVIFKLKDYGIEIKENWEAMMKYSENSKIGQICKSYNPLLFN